MLTTNVRTELELWSLLVGNQRLSSALLKGILASVQIKGTESYLHFSSHSGFSHQTSIAETQKESNSFHEDECVLIQKVQVGCRFCKSHLGVFIC